MPKGVFICTYTGILLDSVAADQQGREQGDTYLADLDLLENLEESKVENQETYDLANDNLNGRNRSSKRSFFHLILLPVYLISSLSFLMQLPMYEL